MTSNGFAVSIVFLLLLFLLLFLKNSEIYVWCAFICVYDLLTGRPAKIRDHFWMKKTKFIRHTHQIIKIYCFLYSSLMISVYTSYLTPYLGARAHTVSVCPFDFRPLLLSKKQTTTNKWSNGQFIFFIIANYCDFYTYKTNNKNHKLSLFNWHHHITIYEKNMMLCRTKCSHHFSLSCCLVSLHLKIQERTKKKHPPNARAPTTTTKF